jgi:hypothetical protein
MVDSGVLHSVSISLGRFWLDAEFGERDDRLFHRQANDVCVRAVDFRNNLRAVTLGGVGAGFIQRMHFRQVIIDQGVAQTAKANPRNLMKGCRSSGGEMTNENGGTHFVSSSAQAP